MSGFYSWTRRCDLQNAKRRAKQVCCFARLNHPSYGPKKPEICLSPNGLRRNVAVPTAKPCFRAAAPIWDGNRGDSRGNPANPHTILCTTHRGHPRNGRFDIPSRVFPTWAFNSAELGRARVRLPSISWCDPGSRSATPRLSGDGIEGSFAYFNSTFAPA